MTIVTTVAMDFSSSFGEKGSFFLFCINTLFLVIFVFQLIYIPLFCSSLSKISGPKAFALTKWRLAYEDWKGTRTPCIHKLHQKYGDAVRIGPNEVSFSSLAALRTIYGAGSGFERDRFYRMFDVYGRQNLFTFGPSKVHADRKKLLNHAYSKSAIVKGPMAAMVEEKTRLYLRLLEMEPESACEIFTSLHYYSIDSITQFLYGDKHGGTKALEGSKKDRALLNDVIDPTRRKLSWFAVHFPRYTKWLYARTGLTEKVITSLGLLPMQKPATYTGIRAHALDSWKGFKASSDEVKNNMPQESIIGRLWKYRQTSKDSTLDDLDIASECADHLLAGIDTTSDTLMFLIWALSLPQNKKYQERLIQEISEIDQSKMTEGDIPSTIESDTLPYLDACIKETLRLYAPLPASEPRSLPTDATIGGYLIPARTVVSMAPYTLHRNADVFPDPFRFNPERWLPGPESADDNLMEMKKWFWPFSSGGRMCIGLHLAMAEMTTLMAAIYGRYRTSVQDRQKGISPGITSRFEVFYDETFEKMEEHTCWIDFQKL